MEKYKNKKFVTLYGSKGQHLVKTPNGEKINGVTMTRVTDTINEMPYVLLKLYCNIANNDEDFEAPKI